GDGMTLLTELKAQASTVAVILVTAHGDIASAVDAVRAGATDYLVKPVDLGDLVLRSSRAAQALQLRDRLDVAEAALRGQHPPLPSRSAAMRAAHDIVARVASTPGRPLLLLGETGVGKEVLARQAHAMGADPAAPFVQVNCAALQPTTVESELFGHEKGAF